MMPHEGRYIDTRGAKAYARTAGDGDQAMVLLHGAEADGSMWEPYLEGLAKGRRVIALDLPGHGSSTVPRGMDCSPSGIASWFIDVLDSEGVDVAVVLGHSFGGVVAFNLALDVPDRVSHLVGVNVANLNLSVQRFREGAYALMDALVEDELDDEMVRRLLGEIYDKATDHPDIVAGAAFWAQPGVRAFFAQGGKDFSRSLPIWRLREVKTPTLLVWGDRDRFFPVEDARTAVMYIPNSRLVVMSGGAHSPFSDAPEMFYLTVDAFLSDDD
jgi:pimeloyl-ACP methyl ester carboxylesterase